MNVDKDMRGRDSGLYSMKLSEGNSMITRMTHPALRTTYADTTLYVHYVDCRSLVNFVRIWVI